MFCKKCVLKNFAKFTLKHLCQSLFFAGLRSATLLKKRLWHRCFSVKFVKFLRTPFFIEHLWWLLLNLGVIQTLLMKLNDIDQMILAGFHVKIAKQMMHSHGRKMIKEAHTHPYAKVKVEETFGQ